MSGITTEPKKSVALVKMIPRIYGKPCVMVSRDGPVFVSRRIFGIRIEWAWAEYYLLRARNSWVASTVGTYEGRFITAESSARPSTSMGLICLPQSSTAT